MAQLDPHECAVLLQFLRTSEFTIKGELIPVLSSSMHKMEATVIAAAENAKQPHVESEEDIFRPATTDDDFKQPQ